MQNVVTNSDDTLEIGFASRQSHDDVWCVGIEVGNFPRSGRSTAYPEN
jgi:hypothetical protein